MFWTDPCWGGESKSIFQNSRDRPEWPLVKASIIAGSAFPIVAAMGDFHEEVAWFIEEGVGFWAAFDGAWFAAVGAVAHQIAR